MALSPSPLWGGGASVRGAGFDGSGTENVPVIDWSGYLGLILQGALVTIQLTLMGSALALVMAFLGGLGRLSRFAAVRALATAYIEFFRGTSIFVQLFWAYFVLPFVGISLTPLQAGVLGLGLNVGAYGAEVVRGAIQAIGREQYEACTALNLGRWQRMRHVILPQAFLVMLPTFGNNAIELLKATSLVSLITLSDLAFRAQTLNQSTFKTVPIFTLVLLIYLVLSLALTIAMRHAETRASRGLARGRAG